MFDTTADTVADAVCDNVPLRKHTRSRAEGMEPGRGGKLGSPEHNALVDLVRWAAGPLLRERWGVEEVQVLVDEQLMQLFLGEHHQRGGRIPDALVLTPAGPIVVEVGRVNPDKWPDFPVLHVGFGGHVSVIAPVPHPFTGAVAEILREALRTQTPTEGGRMTGEAEAVEVPEVFTVWHTAASAGDWSVTVETDPEDTKPGREHPEPQPARAIVSLGSWRLTPTGTTNDGHQMPAVHFECNHAALLDLAAALTAAAETVREKHTPAEAFR